MARIHTVLDRPALATLDRGDLIMLLSCNEPEEIEILRAAAERLCIEQCGTSVHYRGLIEFSNVCTCDCLYCGIRKGNHAVRRYTLSREEILAGADWCAAQGYGSLVLQSGERSDPAFVDFVEELVREIKVRTRSERLANGLGITLCVGQQSRETYQRFFDAGAHRYLLRVETTNPTLFAAVHPPEQTLPSRIDCLRMLQDIGYQTGTGVMIGLPGQTIENLADDIIFFRDMNIDMIGMGPYIAHAQTPLAESHSQNEKERESAFALALKMIAATRLALKDVNIAATTALQALKENGREQGLRHGANILMPQLTPTDVRGDYLLYEGKPCLDENATMCRACLETRLHSVGRELARDSWGDAKHFFARRKRYFFKPPR
jgi:biotin synthase